jgi:hypothetical protein
MEETASWAKVEGAPSRADHAPAAGSLRNPIALPNG